MSIRIAAPLSCSEASALKAGDAVLMSGVVYAARDAAHRKIYELLEKNMELPFSLSGSVVYYMGPSPAPPGFPIGAAGPTTSSRMDAYTPRLLDLGLKGMIGKGKRSGAVKEAIVRNGAVYFAAVGGAGALLSRCIKRAGVIAWPELGAEAVMRLEIVDFPAVVAMDAEGRDLYELGPAEYLKFRGQN